MDAFEQLYENIDEEQNGTICYQEAMCFIKKFMKKKVKIHDHVHVHDLDH